MATVTTYGIGFRRAQTSWKDSDVYFHMHQTSSPYHVGASINHYFGAETFFLPMVLQHIILAHWAVYHAESNSDAF
jgi:hypothetical protein